MAQEKLLPEELEEEILFRVPPLSLVRFKTVCKQWNNLFNDNRFIKNHLAHTHPQFILATNSKFYSVSVNLHDDPKIEVRELTLDIPGLESQIPISIHHQDGLLFCSWDDKTVTVWNPWLRESRWIEPYSKQSTMRIRGIVYDDRKPENSSYKIFATQFFPGYEWKFYNFESNAWKDYKYNFQIGDTSIKGIVYVINSGVSLNGVLYWVASASENRHKVFIISLNCSTCRMIVFCCLPCKTKFIDADAPVLACFRGDRFSLLEKCNEAKKIEIWVNKDKISNEDGKDVDWIKFMTVSMSNFADIANMDFYPPPSYFIYDKTLVVCSCDKNGKTWIYVMRGNKLSKTQIEVDPWPLYSTYTPSLVPVPQGQTEEVELQV